MWQCNPQTIPLKGDFNMSEIMACENCQKKFYVPDVSSMAASHALGAGMALGVHLMNHKETCSGKIYDWPERHPDGLSFEDRLEQLVGK
jgi:hypothetical protein